MLRLAIINGPNLNLLGTREVDIYGAECFESFLEKLKARFPQVILDYFQSNVEGELINKLQSCRKEMEGVIINAAGYSHTSIALGDAIAAISVPVIEVHISNVLAREDYRKTSFIASKCIGSISGLGLEGYALAVQYFLQKH
ncbi:MAG: type II 3-dehydroquinate dehydratase [Bacteroidetes bacterium]|nr:type II 3-dehydroquinate dehydratase [Bacteroidota bacterium]